MASYNLGNVIEMAGEDHDFIQIVVQTFLEEIPPDLAAMNEAIDAENADLAYQYAHKMKPNFQMFGLGLMAQVSTVEAWAKAGKSIDEVRLAARKITKKVSDAERELKEDFDL